MKKKMKEIQIFRIEMEKFSNLRSIENVQHMVYMISNRYIKLADNLLPKTNSSRVSKEIT